LEPKIRKLTCAAPKATKFKDNQNRAYGHFEQSRAGPFGAPASISKQHEQRGIRPRFAKINSLSRVASRPTSETFIFLSTDFSRTTLSKKIVLQACKLNIFFLQRSMKNHVFNVAKQF